MGCGVRADRLPAQASKRPELNRTPVGPAQRTPFGMADSLRPRGLPSAQRALFGPAAPCGPADSRLDSTPSVPSHPCGAECLQPTGPPDSRRDFPSVPRKPFAPPKRPNPGHPRRPGAAERGGLVPGRGVSRFSAGSCRRGRRLSAAAGPAGVRAGPSRRTAEARPFAPSPPPGSA